MVQIQLKLKLNKLQESLLNDWLWYLTGVWNWAIRKIELDAKDCIFYSTFDFQNILAGHSKKLGIPSQVLQGMLIQAHTAWKRCFKKLTKKPRFKSKYNKLESIPFIAPFKNPVKNYITVCGLGQIPFHKMNLPEGKIKCGRIIKRPSGWYLCLFIDAVRSPINRITNYEIGIDPGFKNLLTTSRGEIIQHPRELEDGARRLAQAQRGGNKKLVARLHERMANRRKDRNHKLSLRLIQENSFIAFSSDSHRAIAKKFGKSVGSSAHGQLRQMLKYKSPCGGTTYVEVDPKYSTMTCSNCGAKTGPTGLSGLTVRQWRCVQCGTEHDRDINAARNTLSAALRTSVENGSDSVSETTSNGTAT